MKFIVLGTSEFTLSCCRAILDSKEEICALVSMPENMLPLNSADIRSFARSKGIPYHETADINSAFSIKLLKKYKCDYIFSSWPKILGKGILKIPGIFCIGSHPTALPFNRGRHPLHWLIALGIPESKVSFFVMDEGIDSGNILAQPAFKIGKSASIKKVSQDMNLAAYKGMKKLCALLSGRRNYKGRKQDSRKANYWRKRSVHDVILDLRMQAEMILRTVHSFTPPYPCAKLIFAKSVISIKNAKVLKNLRITCGLKNIEQGKIISIAGNKIRVKADDAIVELESCKPLPKEIVKARYIHPSTKYLADYGGALYRKLKNQ